MTTHYVRLPAHLTGPLLCEEVAEPINRFGDDYVTIMPKLVTCTKCRELLDALGIDHDLVTWSEMS